ncbi:MAG TPA: glycosyltransferase family 2 protein [Chloroflexia bacterium]|nr:glycosyltransferase family 2 protein [Chloroflexia bacterium]
MIEVVQFSTAEPVAVRPAGPANQQAPRIAIAIPAYNEERFIGSVVIQALCYTPEVVVIDDGSADGTTFIAEQAGARVLRHGVNKGKSEAVNTALAWAREQAIDILVFIDGDGQHEAGEIETLLVPIRAGLADMVIGSRFLSVHSSIPRYRQVGQHLFTTITNLASNQPVSDSQSGFRAFSRQAIAVLRFTGTGLSVESEMQFQAKEHQLVIAEVPISVIYAEKAKRNPVGHGLQILSNLVQLVSQHRPLAFFGLQGLLLLGAGAGMALVTVDIFSTTHVLAMGYALLAVLLLILGILTLFVGLILHAIGLFFHDLKKTVHNDRAFRRTP